MPAILYRSLLLVILTTTVSRSLGEINADLFQEKIKTLANEILGVKEFQAYVDRETRYDISTLRGKQVVSDLSESLQNKLKERITIVKTLQEQIQESYDDFDSTRISKLCCDVNDTQNDERFGSEKVNLEEMCTLEQEGEVISAKYPSVHIRDLMKDNMRNVPSLKWQYFGDETGIMTKYPASHYCKTTYDPRFRPWYVETATSEPKDVVVVIDKSGSMSNNGKAGESLMVIAIKAARTVIDTLNPNDRVGVVSFSTLTEVPQGSEDKSTCYKTELARATPRNKKYLKEYVHHLKPQGETYYVPALNAAFDYFSNSTKLETDTRIRDKVILFLTDGRPSEKNASREILDTLRSRNADLNNSVVILTYGIGGDFDEDLLTNMTKAFQDLEHGENKNVGKFTKVDDVGNLRYEMASYYNRYSRTDGVPEPVFTVPYMDWFGIGAVTSVCLPVIKDTVLKGVTCIDLSMSDLLSDVTYFHQGQLSYAFLIDPQGRLMAHPLLPRPHDMQADVVYITMTTIETAEKARLVMDSMTSRTHINTPEWSNQGPTNSDVRQGNHVRIKLVNKYQNITSSRGKTGNMTFSSTRVSARGIVDLQGVTSRSVESQYFWMPIKETPFSVCVVIGIGDKKSNLVWEKPYPSTFVYHRLDLKQPHDACSHFQRVALKDRSTVKFTPDAFENPYRYLDVLETKEHVNKLEDFINGKGSNAGLKAGVKETVCMTAYFDEVLSDNNALQSAIWLYIGTVDGVYRILPGVKSPNKFDHKRRPWYQQTLGQKELYAISTPYEDAFGAGLIVTLGRVVYEARQDGKHDINDPIIGVMAMDFPLRYFYHVLIEQYPDCTQNSYECFIIDVSGFIVVHDDFIDSTDIDDVQNVHITVKEPAFAAHLASIFVMDTDTCINYEELRLQNFWTVNLRGLHDENLVTETFEIHEVKDTNVFLVIKKAPMVSNTECSCQTNKGLLSLHECSRTNSAGSCECPCFDMLQYNYCEEKLAKSVTSDDSPPCTPPSPKIDFKEEFEVERGIAASLPICHEYNCEENQDKEECNKAVRCFWCGKEEDKERFCSSDEMCTRKTKPESPNVGVIAGVTVACVLVVVTLIVGTVFFTRSRRYNCKKAIRSNINTYYNTAALTL